MRHFIHSSLGICAAGAAALGLWISALAGCGAETQEQSSGSMASSSSGNMASSSSTGGGMAGAGGAAGAGGTANTGGNGGQGGTGGSAMAMAMPDFKLLDTNQNSLSYQQEIAVSQAQGKISAWYFGHST